MKQNKDKVRDKIIQIQVYPSWLRPWDRAKLFGLSESGIVYQGKWINKYGWIEWERIVASPKKEGVGK